MKKKKEVHHDHVSIVAIVALFAMVLVLTYGFSQTGGAITKVPAQVSRSAQGPVVTVPAHAVQLAPGIFDLGTAIHQGKKVQGYMFVDYKKGRTHKPNHKARGGKTGGTKCYAHFAKGARWKVTEPYVLNPSNVNGMSSSFVSNGIATSLQAWKNEVAFPIFGSGTLTTNTLVADEISPDGKNEVYFGAIAGQGSIAVTITWGIFSGPPGGRELVEWDMVFDDAEFTFGDALLNPNVMDLLNIGTHEAGHAGGLGHPDDSCLEETMYRFATEGETKKGSLHRGDIEGIVKLY